MSCAWRDPSIPCRQSLDNKTYPNIHIEDDSQQDELSEPVPIAEYALKKSLVLAAGESLLAHWRSSQTRQHPRHLSSKPSSSHSQEILELNLQGKRVSRRKNPVFSKKKKDQPNRKPANDKNYSSKCFIFILFYFYFYIATSAEFLTWPFSTSTTASTSTSPSTTTEYQHLYRYSSFLWQGDFGRQAGESRPAKHMWDTPAIFIHALDSISADLINLSSPRNRPFNTLSTHHGIIAAYSSYCWPPRGRA